MGLSWLLSWWRFCQQCRRPWFDSWVGKIRWRRDKLPTLIFLGFPGGSASKESACSVGDLGSIPGLGRSPGEGNSYLLNSIDCIVHGVAESPFGNVSFFLHHLYFLDVFIIENWRRERKKWNTFLSYPDTLWIGYSLIQFTICGVHLPIFLWRTTLSFPSFELKGILSVTQNYVSDDSAVKTRLG